jgi:programmed cell death 6-interacting protein
MFKQDLEVIDALRSSAIHAKEPHVSGIKKIAAYAGQLTWLGGKFPIDVWFFYTSDKRRYTNIGRLA